MHQMSSLVAMSILLWPWLVNGVEEGQRVTTAMTPVSLLPDCTKTTVVTGEMIQEELDSRRITVSTNLRLSLGLHETVCLYVQTEETASTRPDVNSTVTTQMTPNGTNSSTLRPVSFRYNNGTLVYVIQYAKLSQLHPVRQRYEFGVPYFESKCVCDCPAGSDHCPVGFQYKNCTKGADAGNADDGVCVTTYFANQPATGCIKEDQSEVCCELLARPMDSRRFTALYIGQPDAVAEFRYQMFTALTDGASWTKSTDQMFRVALNKQQRLELENDRLEIRVSGMKPFYQLKNGMYFYENPSSSTRNVQLRDGVPLNELHEYDLGKLGWFRYGNGRWTVRNAWVRLQDAHKVQVKNCKEQTYTETFNAEYYSATGAEDGNSGPVLGHHVTEQEPWIEEVTVEEQGYDQQYYLAPRRNVHRLVVTHKDSNPIEINLSMDSKILLLKTLYHSSALSDFSGSIQIDRLSNRYLNLTMIGARGTLIGTVYRAATRRSADLAFSHFVSVSENNGPYRVSIALPAQVNASRWVCIHPLNRVKDEICKWLIFEMAVLDDKESPANGPTAQQGQCSGCNEMTMQNFLNYLNPAQWLNGISTPAEALAMGVEILFYATLVIISVALCKRIACPIIRWALCGGEPWCSVPAKRTSTSTPSPP